MLTETERKLLTAALGGCWHEHDETGTCKKCGAGIYNGHQYAVNRTFAAAQDYEDLLEKVVRLNIKAFDNFLWDTWEKVTDESEELQKMTDMEWFLTLSIEERNKLIHDFCIYIYKKGHTEFQWVKEFVRKEKV